MNTPNLSPTHLGVSARDEGDGYIVVRRPVTMLDSPMELDVEASEAWRDSVNANGGEYVGEVTRVAYPTVRFGMVNGEFVTEAETGYEYHAASIAIRWGEREMVNHPRPYHSMRAAITAIAEAVK
jgi:hypothetical protein